VTSQRPTTLKDFIYIDEQGIQALVAQVDGGVARDTTTSSKKGRTSSTSFSTKLKLLLAVVIKPEVSINHTCNRMKEDELEQTLDIHVANHLSKITDHLSETSELCTTIDDACRMAVNNDRSVYVACDTQFDAPQFFTGQGTEKVNDSGYLVFQSPNHYNSNDNYYKTNQWAIDMVCSIQKMPRSQHGMGATSHDALYFCGYSGRNIPLSIFGRVTALVEGVIQIKPFAVWL